MATQENINSKASITNPYLYSNVWGCRWVGDVTYSFGEGVSPTSPASDILYSETAGAWRTAEQQALCSVLEAYSNVCNIRFVETGFDSNHASNLIAYKVSSLTLGQSTSGVFEVPDAAKPDSNSLYGYFNATHKDWSNFTAGGSGFELLLHELGHAVGLAHPHDGGDGFEPRPYPGVNSASLDPDDMGDHFLNQGIWSTMSYNDGWTKTGTGQQTNLYPAANGSFGYQATPMAFDVAALQFLYGANMQYHTDNDTYTLTQTNAVGTGWLCIWDAGGIDTISNSGANIACTIDLRAAPLTDSVNGGGYVSYARGIAGGLTIANGAVIENAIGGTAADTLIGNALKNALRGNAGNDVLDGGADIDTAIYAGFKAQYQINRVSGTTTDTVANRDGSDTLTGIERLQFADTMVGLDVGKGGNTGEVYRLYLTVLGRNPQTDAEGCGFWIDKLDRNILTTEQMVGYFLNSDEFVSRFGGTTNTNESFVNLMYLNLLGRNGHPDSGFGFWLNVLDNQLAARQQVVADFMESPENVTNAAPLIGDTPTYQQWVG